VRSEFTALCRTSTPTKTPTACAGASTEARSLRELWHLRADTFRVVGISHSQTEAERRLTR
jgi:hypothetical protein